MKNPKYILIGIGVVVLILIIMIVGLVAIAIVFPNNNNFLSEDNKIVVIEIDNPLMLKTENPGMFGTREPSVKDYIDELDRAEKDKSVKGILLKVNCPGGEVVASEKLARKVKEVSEKKPVVSYVETLGASGAYMAIAPTYIVAEKHSIVGSIGVRMDILHYYGLMKKIGVNVSVIKAGKYKDIGSPYRPMTPEEKEYLQKMINETYDDFVKWVSENRHIPLNKTYKIADGKIYSGIDAKKVGLVDKVGTEEDAINITAKMCNITNPNLVYYSSSEPNFLLGVINRISYYMGYGIGKALIENSDVVGKINSNLIVGYN